MAHTTFGSIRPWSHKQSSQASEGRYGNLSWFAALGRLLCSLACGLAYVALLTNCSSPAAATTWDSVCQSVGLCDAPVLAPVAVDVLCDASNGSSCSSSALDETLSLALRHAIERPGARVRLWVLGASLAETRMVGEQTIPAFTTGGERSKRAQAERFLATARAFFRVAVGDLFGHASLRRSPLMEAVTKIAVTDAGGIARHLVVVSDGREFSSLGDWECRRLPSEAELAQALRRRRVLDPGTLANVRVQFVHVEAGPIPLRGCAVRLDRELRVRALWTAVLERAGAVSVRLDAGPARFDETTARSVR